jgi:DNA-binding response OmpR family regulator
MSAGNGLRDLPRVSAHFAGWSLDIVGRRLCAPDGVATELPGTEFTLLLAFLDRPRQVLTRDVLARALEERGPYASPRTLDVYVSRLRRRFSAGQRGSSRLRATRGLIVTCRHAGYVLRAAPVFE